MRPVKNFWIAVSATCFAAAALLLWRQHLDAAFVIATIGALAWFLNYRSRLKELLPDELISEPDSAPGTDQESNQSNDK
jgi:hypothetical protein